jgi:hypothetical protein
MADSDLMTAANMAKSLGASDAKVKKLIKELGIEPAAKKGVCSYFDADALAKVKAALG